MPDLRLYSPFGDGVGYDVAPVDTDLQRGRHGACAEWLHQMRPDLGRLDAVAEILQVGPVLGSRQACLASRSARWYIATKMQGAFHESFSRGGGFCVPGRTVVGRIILGGFARGRAHGTCPRARFAPYQSARGWARQDAGAEGC